MKVFSIIWKIVIALLLIGATIAFVSQLGHAESLKHINEKGRVGQRVKVSGYVRTGQPLDGGRYRMELCDAPASLPRKHYHCIFLTFQIPSMAWVMPSPGEHVTCTGKGVITKKE